MVPDKDPGDVFLRRRGAVLDALLSDSSLSVPAPSAPSGPAFPEPALPEPGAPGMSADEPLDYADSMFEPPPRLEEINQLAAAGAGLGPRSRSGPRASDRINALLSGERVADTPPPAEMDRGDALSRMLAQDDDKTTDSDTDTKVEQQPLPKDEFSKLLMNPKGNFDPQQLIVILKRPRVLAALGGALAFILLLVLLFSGGEESTKEKMLVTAPPSAAATSPAPPGKGNNGAGAIEVVSAASHCPPGSTDGMDAFNGKDGKAWSCKRAYRIDGQILEIDLGKTYEVDSIGIVPGWDHVGADGQDEWTKHRTVTRVSYTFNDANHTTYTQETLDQRKLVTTKIDPPVKATKVVLTVLKSTGDSAVNDVAISSIVITGQ
ncbi:MAG: discoidin domain-containing protein [Mycobacteriaceae bacterium]|nr:discoidin domain-containing protein [Mycobacteriaceae bacterium]